MQALAVAAGQDELDLRLQPDAGAGAGPLPITSSRMGHLWDALACGYAVLGLEQAAAGDAVFRDLVLARIIEPTSVRVLEEAGMAPASLSHDQPAAGGLCPGLLTGRAVGGVRGACRARPGQPGPL